MLTVFYSNRVEELYQQLKSQLFPGDPFTKRRIVVPSPPLKSWLNLKLAKDLGISAGIEVSYPDEMLKKLGITFDSPLELALRIESELRQMQPFSQKRLLALSA